MKRSQTSRLSAEKDCDKSEGSCGSGVIRATCGMIIPPRLATLCPPRLATFRLPRIATLRPRPSLSLVDDDVGVSKKGGTVDFGVVAGVCGWCGKAESNAMSLYTSWKSSSSASMVAVARNVIVESEPGKKMTKLTINFKHKMLMVQKL